MYLRKVHIENIRSIAELDWEIPEGQEPGWHVVIGDNGSGKTTFMRAVALALVGDQEVIALVQDFGDWVRNGEDEGGIEIKILWRDGESSSPTMRVSRKDKFPFFDPNVGSEIPVDDDESVMGNEDMSFLDSPNFSGEFSAAYGPFRRFSGGDPDSRTKFLRYPKLGAHLSIFGEQYPLTECLEWLKELKFKQLEGKPEGKLLDKIEDFVNQTGFLPHSAQLTDVSSDGVIFTDGDGSQVPVEELSDGYRSVLSMTFELIRQMSRAFAPEQIFSPGDSSKIVAPGVVLIDEVDAHLHPTWQRRIGLWFREHFPNIQFIVTTHSPLVCQAAEHGTVFRLPAPGSGEKAEMVTGIALNRLLYGNVLDAYGTELFGEDMGRSEAAQKLLRQLAELNVKEVNQGLSKTEKKKQQELRATFPTSQAISNGQGKRRK